MERDGTIGADEHHRAGHECRVRRPRRAWRQLHFERFPIGLLLGGGDVAGCFDEPAELRVVDVVTVHPETADFHAMSRTLVRLRELMVTAHEELATGDPSLTMSG